MNIKNDKNEKYELIASAANWWGNNISDVYKHRSVKEVDSKDEIIKFLNNEVSLVEDDIQKRLKFVFADEIKKRLEKDSDFYIVVDWDRDKFIMSCLEKVGENLFFPATAIMHITDERVSVKNEKYEPFKEIYDVHKFIQNTDLEV